MPLRNESEPFDVVPPAHFKEESEPHLVVFAARNKNEHDVVECAWTDRDKKIAVTMTVNASRIDFDLREVPACTSERGRSCVTAARAWVESVVELEGVDSYQYAYRVDLPWPPQLSDGIRFSSAPDLDIMNVVRWHLRVDAEVQNGVLSIYVYKRIAQLLSFQEASRWFPDDFRAEIQKRARELPSVPPDLDGSEE